MGHLLFAVSKSTLLEFPPALAEDARAGLSALGVNLEGWGPLAFQAAVGKQAEAGRSRQ
jgi:hypothetical protein